VSLDSPRYSQTGISKITDICSTYLSVGWWLLAIQ